jgi:ankyrin repeat protein
MFRWLLDNTLDGYISPVISTNLLSDLLFRPNDYSSLYGIVYDPKPNDDDMFLIAKDLIGLGANVNLVDGEGRTAMHRVVMNKHSDKTVLLLLKADANINNEDEDRHTPFNHAAFHYGPKIISQFIKHGGNVNNGVLVSAADDNTSGEVIRVLVSAGADVNFKDGPDNVTPLHATTRLSKSFEVIKALVECGADVNAITKGYEISPYTPIDNVRRNIRLSEGLSSDGKANAIDLEILDYLENADRSQP